jgi:hypothetical protein
MSKSINPLPYEALNGLGITPIVKQNKESDKSSDNSNTLPKEKRIYRLVPTLAEALVNTQPDKPTIIEEYQIKIDALKKGIADADEIRAKEAAAERRKINDWVLDKRIKEAKAKAEALSSTGGYKKVKDKYTVKELKAIASRNNIKITKKLNGKTVPLNKKGLVAKLKRNKVI